MFVVIFGILVTLICGYLATCHAKQIKEAKTQVGSEGSKFALGFLVIAALAFPAFWLVANTVTTLLVVLVVSIIFVVGGVALVLILLNIWGIYDDDVMVRLFKHTFTFYECWAITAILLLCCLLLPLGILFDILLLLGLAAGLLFGLLELEHSILNRFLD